jgi:hypothetical protein
VAAEQVASKVMTKRTGNLAPVVLFMACLASKVIRGGTVPGRIDPIWLVAILRHGLAVSNAGACALYRVHFPVTPLIGCWRRGIAWSS